MRDWMTPAAAVLAALLLSGCSLLSPQTAQLERMKEHRLKNDLESNSRESITCTAADTACYQLHLIKGDACSTLAAHVTDAALRRNLDACAADNLREGVALAPAEQTPVGDLHEYDLKRLEALRDLIDTRRAKDASAEALAEAAQDFRRRYVADPAGTFYLASARLTVVEDKLLAGDTAGVCTALSDIDALERSGGADLGNLQSQYRNLAKSVANLRRAGGCT
jgi:hypothetical protein